MGKWLAGIVAAVISGLLVLWLAGELWSDGDPTPPDPEPNGPTGPTVEVEGSSVVTLPGVHIPPEQAGSLRWVQMSIDLDTGLRDDGPSGDVDVAIDFDERISWLQSAEAVEVDSSPTYQDCSAALSGAGQYVQPFAGQPTICVRTDEGRVAWYRMREVSIFPEPDGENFYTIEAPYEFRTWALNP